MLASRFKVLCADAGLSVDETAKLLHVTPRTVRYWISGKVSIPYAAYKLVRVLRWFELPGKDWAGWHFHSNRLWSPEGHGFDPKDSNWWSLLVNRARLFNQLYDRHNALQHALHPKAARATGSHEGGPGTGGTQGGRLTAPPGDAGGSGAAAPPNLLLEHFRT